jgi:hypothetical protein
MLKGICLRQAIFSQRSQMNTGHDMVKWPDV